MTDMKKNSAAKHYILMVLMLLLSWGNFQIAGLYFYTIFQTVYCLVGFCASRGRIRFSRSFVINGIYALLILSTCSSLITDLPRSYKVYSLVMAIVLIPSYFSYTYLMRDLRNGNVEFSQLIRWMKIGFLVQLLYLPVQFLFYRMLGLDLNKILFSDLLHLMDDPTFFRQGTFFPSGFVWHSAVIAPMLVLSFLLFDNVYVKALTIADAFICGNNTALIGVALACLFTLLHGMTKRIDRIKQKKALAILSLLFLAAIALIGLRGWNQIIDKIQYLIYRITATGTDSSSRAHLSYYTLYPKVLKTNGVFTGLFGTGYGSSGYSITQLNGQYAGLKHWVVESDIVDILISRGIVGFLFYYAFLGILAFRGRKIDYKYLVAIFAIAIQGITYNVQFEYLFFIELLLFGSIELKENVFRASAKH